MAAKDLYFRAAVPKITPKREAMRVCAEHNLRHFNGGTHPSNIDPRRTPT